MNNLHYRSLSIAPRDGDSPFVEAAAVDAWDAWFRWRDYGVLRDLTVDATWDRVATALASVERAESATIWKRRFVDAFSAWQLLLDERILATAGTAKSAWSGDGLVAVLNVAAFVRMPSTMQASFDKTAFEEIVALAVRALDDATMLVGSHAAIDSGFRIGLVGLMDAFALLGLSYDSTGGRGLAALVAQTLAQGCHRGALHLTRERGGSVACTEAWRVRARAQGIAPEIVAEAERRGIRHSLLTAITSQPKLALFANNIADAMDPLVDAIRADRATDRDVECVALARSHAIPGRQPNFATQGSAVDCTASSVIAQLKLRAATQNWIDEPIDYPLLLDRDPGDQLLTTWAAMAADLGLPQARWRSRYSHGAGTQFPCS
jgi:ribonucleoside-diphosphate reductase alpha chain